MCNLCLAFLLSFDEHASMEVLEHQGGLSDQKTPTIHQSTRDIECSKPTTVPHFYACFSSFEIYFSLIGNK